MSDETLLKIALSAAVPLRIFELKKTTFAYRQKRAEICADYVAFHGDNILYPGSKPGETAEAFNRLAEGLACLAFCPGGVDAFGMHFEAIADEDGGKE